MEKVINEINEVVREEVYRQGVDIREVKIDFLSLVADAVLDQLDGSGKLSSYIESFELDDDGKLVLDINHHRVIEEHVLCRKAYNIQLAQQEKEYWDSRRVE